MNKLLVNILGYGGALALMLFWYSKNWNVHVVDVNDDTEEQMSLMTLCAALWSLHYAKRLLEVFFIHQWSRNSLPVTDGLIEWSYYWGFGAWISYEITSSRLKYVLVSHTSTAQRIACMGMIACMIGNGVAHWQLRQHRPKRAETWPTGLLFSYISCPHYTFEVGTWLCFAVLLSGGQYSCYTFWVAGTAVLVLWSKERHDAYHKTFPMYPPQRAAMIPFLW